MTEHNADKSRGQRHSTEQPYRSPTRLPTPQQDDPQQYDQRKHGQQNNGGANASRESRVSMPRLLVLSRSPKVAAALAAAAPEISDTARVADLDAAVALVRSGASADVCILDPNTLPDALQQTRGVPMLDGLREQIPQLPVVVLVESLQQGLEAMRCGAHGFLRTAQLKSGLIAESLQVAMELHRVSRDRDDAQAKLFHLDRMASLGQLMAGVAHELKAPTAFLLHNLRAMKERLSSSFEHTADRAADDAALAELLRELTESVDDSLKGIGQVCSIVNDLSEFSRAENDEVGLVDLNKVIDTACELTYGTVQGRARMLKIQQPVARILGNYSKMVQVFTNLITNAAHAIAEGAPEDNEVRVYLQERNGFVIVAVEDTGCGIPPELSELVFEPFFTTKPKGMGSGLGLSLSAEIVRHHKGQLTFTPRPAGGTRFEVRFRTARADKTSRTPKPPARAVPKPALRRFRVLLIDDDQNMLRAYRRVLSSHHDVVLAASGQEAIDILKHDPAFDTIICDFMMPFVDGIAVYNEVCALHPQLAKRIAFCTGGAVTEQGRAFLKSTPNVVLEKPVPPEELLQTIDQLSHL